MVLVESAPTRVRKPLCIHVIPIENAQNYYEGVVSDFSQVGAKALDDQTLEVTLNHPTPYFLQLLDHYSLFPVHKETIEKFGSADQRGTRWTYAGNLVGNGAFTLEEWEINRKIVVKKNENYWDAENVRLNEVCLLYTSPSPRDGLLSRMPSSA